MFILCEDFLFLVDDDWDDAPKAVRSTRSTKASTKCKFIIYEESFLATDDWHDEPMKKNTSIQGIFLYYYYNK